MQLVRPHPRPAESETQGRAPAVCGLTCLLGDADILSNLRTTKLANGLKRHPDREC